MCCSLLVAAFVRTRAGGPLTRILANAATGTAFCQQRSRPICYGFVERVFRRGRASMALASESVRRPGEGGICELAQDVSGSPFYNPDMAPTTRRQRKWAMKDIAALWISMSAC